MSDAIRAGELDRRISLLQATVRTNEFQERVSVWSVAVSGVPARKEYLSGDEQYSTADKSAVVKICYTIRWMAGVLETMRVTDGSTTYGIDSIEEIGRRVGLRLFVVGPVRE